jgi:hypothetical protein
MEANFAGGTWRRYVDQPLDAADPLLVDAAEQWRLRWGVSSIRLNDEQVKDPVRWPAIGYMGDVCPDCNKRLGHTPFQSHLYGTMRQSSVVLCEGASSELALWQAAVREEKPDGGRETSAEERRAAAVKRQAIRAPPTHFKEVAKTLHEAFLKVGWLPPLPVPHGSAAFVGGGADGRGGHDSNVDASSVASLVAELEALWQKERPLRLWRFYWDSFLALTSQRQEQPASG